MGKLKTRKVESFARIRSHMAALVTEEDPGLGAGHNSGVLFLLRATHVLVCQGPFNPTSGHKKKTKTRLLSPVSRNHMGNPVHDLLVLCSPTTGGLLHVTPRPHHGVSALPAPLNVANHAGREPRFVVCLSLSPDPPEGPDEHLL